MKSFSRVRLFATPWTVAYEASPSMGFFQARVLECIAISFSRGSSRPQGSNPGLPHCRPTLYLVGPPYWLLLVICFTYAAAAAAAKSLQFLASGRGVLRSPRSDGKAAGTQSGHWAPRRPWSPACAFPSDWPTRVTWGSKPPDLFTFQRASRAPSRTVVSSPVCIC